jgi:hypothetical protein
VTKDSRDEGSKDPKGSPLQEVFHVLRVASNLANHVGNVLRFTKDAFYVQLYVIS